MYSVPAQKYTVYTKNTYPISKHDHLLAAGLTEPVSAQRILLSYLRKTTENA